jgi:hypothetical protein
MVARKKSTQMLRQDKKQKCVTGKQCRDICIPKTKTCRETKVKQDPVAGLSYELDKEKGELAKVKLGKREASYSYERSTKTVKLAAGKKGRQKTVELDLKNPAVVAGVVGGFVGISLAHSLAKGIIRDKVEDIKTYRQFEKDRNFWEKTGVPDSQKGAYDHPDKNLKMSLLAAEHEIKDMPRERLYIFDKHGNPIVIRGGKEGSVGLGITDIPKIKQFDNTGAVVTHNHPGGATFSSTDILTAGRLGLSEIRATTSTDTYILKPKNRTTFDLPTNKTLLALYAGRQSRIIRKHKEKLLDKELPFDQDFGKATKNLLYYSTMGKSTLNKELLRSVEFEAHQELERVINTRFKDQFVYRRVPRYTTPKREQQFINPVQKILKNDSIHVYHAVMDAIASIYGEIDGYPSVQQNDNESLSGIFRDGHQIYDYSITHNGVLSYVESTRSDSYLVGFSIDSGYNKRQDTAATKKPKKCIQGKPCKNTCIAKGVTCRVQLGSKELLALKQVSAAIKSPPSKTKTKQNARSPELPLGKAAIALTATAAFALGAGLIAKNLTNKEQTGTSSKLKTPELPEVLTETPKVDVEGSFHALVGVYQDALNASGVREVYPATVTAIERLVGGSGGAKGQQKTAEALGGTIMMAHVDSEKEKADPKLQKQTAKTGRVSAKERLSYIGKLIDDETRSQDFKIALNKFSNNVKPPPYPEELAALRYYTDSKGYQEMNRTLRGQVDGLQTWLKTSHKDTRSRSQIKADAEQDIKMTNSALNALPDHKGEVYRGLTLPETAIPRIGETWNEKGFTSTTKNAFTRYPGNVAMVIQSKSGKDITPYEKYKNDEVLFKPNTSFKVTEKRKVKKFGKEFWLVKMQQDD